MKKTLFLLPALAACLTAACDKGGDGPDPDPTPYITKVLEYMPAPGQFVNTMPEYEAGDDQRKMNAKALAAIGNNKRGMISLGGYGGYVILGFDHTIENVDGLCDFRVLGNAVRAEDNPDPAAPTGGSSEPGIIMVARDANGNGAPDEWFEIAGSAHRNAAGEAWYQRAVDNGNNVALHTGYRITYHSPVNDTIRWKDNKGGSGYRAKNVFHDQSYFPMWITMVSEIDFKGTRLPQNGIDESGDGTYFVQYEFGWGYADNAPNNEAGAAIDIDWAVDAAGQPVHLSGIDFIKIYTGVNQECGWVGESSTEVTGVEDLHMLGVEINSNR